MMKRALFLLILAIFIASCAEEPMGTSAVTDAGEGSDGDTGGFFWDQPETTAGGIPIEGNSSEPAGKKESPSPDPKAIKPVEITKGSNLGTCVVGEACEKKISAHGGSGEYAWTLIEGNLPKGLELADTTAKKAKIKKIDGQEIDAVGEFAFTLKVEDAADAARSAERKFTLRVNEDIAMNLYAVADNENGEKEWKLVQEKDESGDDILITVPPNGKLLAVVIGHAESYRWSIDGLEITCSADSCAGENENIRLYKDTDLEPQGLPPHHQSIVIEAMGSFIDQEVKNVVIAAAQDYGDPVSKTISSITFQQEPCKIPLTVTGGTQATIGYGEEYTLAINIQGGSGKLEWKTTKTSTNMTNGMAAPKMNDAEGRQTSISGKVDAATNGMTPEQYLQGETITLQYEVTDSCPQPNMATVDVTIEVKADEEILKLDPEKRSSTLHLGANDTDSSSTIKLFLTNDLNENVGWWTEAVGLDQHGDGETCWYCYDIDGNHSVSQPSMKFVSGLSVDKIKKVRFYIKDPGSGGWVDVKINEYHISFPHWSGAAQGANCDMDDISDGSYRDFNIAWTYTE